MKLAYKINKDYRPINLGANKTFLLQHGGFPPAKKKHKKTNVSCILGKTQ